MVVDTFPSFRDETWLDGRKGELASNLYVQWPNNNINKFSNIQYLFGNERKSSSRKPGPLSSRPHQPPVTQYSQGLLDQASNV
jgi:hypothetical protein